MIFHRRDWRPMLCQRIREQRRCDSSRYEEGHRMSALSAFAVQWATSWACHGACLEARSMLATGVATRGLPTAANMTSGAMSYNHLRAFPSVLVAKGDS